MRGYFGDRDRSGAGSPDEVTCSRTPAYHVWRAAVAVVSEAAARAAVRCRRRTPARRAKSVSRLDSTRISATARTAVGVSGADGHQRRLRGAQHHTRSPVDLAALSQSAIAAA